MEFFRKVKRKIEEGYLKDVMNEVRWLWDYVRHYRLTVVIHLVMAVLAIVMGLGTSVASKYLLDAVTGHQTGTVGQAAAVMVGMMVGNIAMKAVSARVGALINVRVQNEIQAEVYQRILDTDWESLEQYRSGDLMNRLTGDVGSVAGGVTGFAPSLIANLVQFFGALGIILWYDPTMAAIALLGIPAGVLSSRFLLGRMREYNKKMKALSSDVMSFYEDSLSNLTSIKAFDITSDFCGKMLGLQSSYRDQYLSYNKFVVYTTSAVSLMGMVVSAGCFGWGAYRLWTGAISFGSMAMFLQLASTLSGAFSALIGMVSSAISITTSAGRVMEVVQLPSEFVEREQSFRQAQNLALHIEDADFTYRSGERVLEHVNFQAGHGELVALTGPSGEGKTTMLRMLLGLIRPQEGRAVLSWDGGEEPLSSATRSAFAYVPQGNSMFAGTIEDNLRLTKPDATEEELKQVLKIACAYDFVRELPDGLKHPVGSRGKGLSEGQAQRLAVARALLRGAPILLLDESTSALDEDTERRLLHNLMACGLVNTCVFVTHRTGAMRFCSRQYRVENGRVTLERKDER